MRALLLLLLLDSSTLSFACAASLHHGQWGKRFINANMLQRIHNKIVQVNFLILLCIFHQPFVVVVVVVVFFLLLFFDLVRRLICVTSLCCLSYFMAQRLARRSKAAQASSNSNIRRLCQVCALNEEQSEPVDSPLAKFS